MMRCLFYKYHPYWRKLMKIKMIRLSAVFFFFCFCLNAFAQADLSSLHASKGNAKSTKNTLRSGYPPMTDIQVVNHSYDPITVKVPGTSINDILLPGEIEYT